MKLRVLIIIATNNIGGPGKGIFQLINESDRDKVEFTLVNFIQKGQKTFEFMEESKRQGIKLHLITQNSRFDASMIKQASNVFEIEKCNLIQTHGYKGHIIGYLLRKKFNVKWITVSHGWTSENFRIKIYSFIEKVFIKLSDHSIVVSPLLYKSIGNMRGLKKPTTLILNAINDKQLVCESNDFRVTRKLDDHFLIGVFGRLSSEKGQEYAIRAISLLKNRLPNIKLLLFGEGPDESSLKDFALSLGVETHVLFCGYMQNINEYIQMVDCILVPSLSEGIPNIILESLVNEKLVIATNVGGIPEIITDNYNGLLVEAGNESMIAAAISSCVENHSKVQRLVSNAKNSLFPKFSINNRVNSFLEVYNDVSRS